MNKALRDTWKSQGKACYYCGEPVSSRQATLDHVYPQHLGTFTLTYDNLVCACPACNNRKGGMLPEQWAQEAPRGEGFPGEIYKPWQEFIDWYEETQEVVGAPATCLWTIADSLKK